MPKEPLAEADSNQKPELKNYINWKPANILEKSFTESDSVEDAQSEPGKQDADGVCYETDAFEFSKIRKYAFYFFSALMFFSLLWTLIFSVQVFLGMAFIKDVPQEQERSVIAFRLFAAITVFLSVWGLKYLSRTVKDRRAYHRSIKITNNYVLFKETNLSGTKEWKEKIKRYESVVLTQVKGSLKGNWFIYLKHKDNTKNIPIFYPMPGEKLPTEEERDEKLNEYAAKFKLPALNRFKKQADTEKAVS